MAAIVERLRLFVPHCEDPNDYLEDELLFLKAADEIERLREALHYYADKSHWHVKYGDTYILVDEGRIARAALGEKEL